LQNNIDLLQALGDKAGKQRTFEEDAYVDEYDTFLEVVSSIRRELSFFLSHVHLLHSRLARITEAVSIYISPLWNYPIQNSGLGR